MLQFSALFLFISCSTFLPTEFNQSEKDKGSIEGIISNEHDQAIPNALIYLQKDSELIKVATSDSLGQYKFSSIKADTYSINVAYVGYFKKEINDIIIDNHKIELDIKMKELRCTHGH